MSGKRKHYIRYCISLPSGILLGPLVASRLGITSTYIIALLIAAIFISLYFALWLIGVRDNGK